MMKESSKNIVKRMSKEAIVESSKKNSSEVFLIYKNSTKNTQNNKIFFVFLLDITEKSFMYMSKVWKTFFSTQKYFTHFSTKLSNERKTHDKVFLLTMIPVDIVGKKCENL